MADLWTYLVGQAQANQFLSGAVLGGAVLASLNYLRQAGLWAGHALLRRLTVSATVHSEDELFVPLSRWLSQHRFDAYAQQYRVRTPRRDEYYHHGPGDEDEQLVADAVFGPSYGAYTFRYAGRWLRVAVAKEGDAAGQNSSRNAQTREFLTLTYLGLSSRLLSRIMEEAIATANRERRTTLPCFHASMHGWEMVGSMRRVSQTACPVVLDGRILEDLEADVEEFLGRREWYDARGIPWRRGYLLHGPPGTGKTSLCRHLARRFGLKVYVVDVNGMMCDLGVMLKRVRGRSLVLFEDIDCHDLTQRPERVERPGPKSLAPRASSDTLLPMNIGTLLNAIDGVNPAEEMLIVMTSNNPEVLDQALIRPGRIDRKIYLGLCTRDHAVKLLLKFFPGLPAGDVAEFRAMVGHERYSPADLQELFITGDFASVMRKIAPPCLEHGGRPMTMRELVEAEGG